MTVSVKKISRTFVLVSLLLFFPVSGLAITDNQYNKSDTVLTLDEISVTAIKQGLNLQNEAIASTVIGRRNIERQNIVTVKNMSDIVPNFYIPDYGSRMTSSIYVRGIGARIDQPVIGLNVDNVPFLNKDNYDFDLIDIERIEMLRGPQSTLFGRNTMGGLINIYTLSPLSYQGIRMLGEYSNGNSYRIGLSYYKKIRHNLGIAVIGSYFSTDGFYKNLYNNKNCDWEKNGSARLKLQWRPGKNVKIENTFSFTMSRQGGYPYSYTSTGEISYNDTCFYKRTSISDGLTVNFKINDITLSSITSFQYINDNMTLDQDFLPVPYFTLTQARRESAVTQDFIARGNENKKYKWLAGVFAFYKHTDMDAPVTFKDDGIKNLIEDKRNEVNPDYPIEWDTREFILNSNFKNPNFGVAAYHQSSLDLGKWTLTAGIRFDFEQSCLNYHSQCDGSYTTYYFPDKDGRKEVYSQVPVVINDKGELTKSFFEILPKISALYHLPFESPSNVYASIAKGYKAGGFNTQMFSDVLQQKIMKIMGIGAQYDINDVVGYKPEKSWTFEVGAHIECYDRKIQTDISVFYISCTDQQLTIFPDGTTTGRIMTNAGKTRSAGTEIAVKLRPVKNFEFNVSYGYTNAKFVNFNNGKTDYSGKYIPYAPRNTMFIGANYSLPIRHSWLNYITFNVNAKGTGKIYWDEANNEVQPFYTLIGGSVRLEHQNYSLDLWVQNITDKKYDTFYFVSMSNAFVQRGKPIQFGATLRINI